ncbi:unnamed protein product [Aureobasidium mustum]|uniref:Uncharacterized protein n=1 Tax=Aureobasidium mustum TaxID=2773714 RepID=A0A9N8PM20_9PEZI|nr:unnamed protein product [Aureobasidium mustum]
MPTGQTQRRFGAREKALEPRSIKDIRNMLNPATRGTRIRNHKTIAGIMFFDIDCVRLVERTGRMTYFRHCLVAGEDPHEEGCLAAMYLSDEAGVLRTTHMRSIDDTRGGIPEVAWCSSLQLKRKIFTNGTESRSYTAIRNLRRDYCKELLGLFDDSRPFDNQNWQDFRVCSGLCRIVIHLTCFRMLSTDTKICCTRVDFNTDLNSPTSNLTTTTTRMTTLTQTSVMTFE